MRRVILLAMAMLVCINASATANGEDAAGCLPRSRFSGTRVDDEVKYVMPAASQATYASGNWQEALDSASQPVYVAEGVPCEEAPPPPMPKDIIVAVLHYHNSHSKAGADFDFAGMKMKSDKGHASGAGVTVVYNRIFNPVFSLGFLYEYTFMNVRSGAATPDFLYDDAANGMRSYERSRWYSNGVGLLPKFDLGKWGRFMPYLTLGWDRVSSGTERFVNNAGGGQFQPDRNMKGDGANLASAMLWYEKDFQINDRLKLTPYAGSQNLHIEVINQPVKMWAHFVSGGLKGSYQAKNVNLSFRAGVHHRTTHGEFAGWGSRITAPGVAHFTHKATQDRTVATFGAGAEFMVKRALVGLSYDGWVGKDTSTHMANLTLGMVF